ncbi:MAG TPA: hypothetical protein VGM92_08765 [Candidatus Kapabacteria bacterium]
MKQLIPDHWKLKTYESDLCIRLKMGSEFHVIGLDKAQRFEGSPWDGVHITEYADCKEGIWDLNIRPALTDRRGWAIIEGTPDFDKPNNFKYEEQYLAAISGNDPSLAAFAWRSREVLPAEEVEAWRTQMDPLYFEQEEGGGFIRTPDAAYYSWGDSEESGNLDSALTVNPRLPIYIACDFNFPHHVWSLCQVENRKQERQSNGIILPNQIVNERRVNVLRELYLRNADVNAMCKALKETLKSMETEGRKSVPGWTLDEKSVIFTGDFSGNQRRAEATYRAWEIVQNEFPKASLEIKVNPSVPDRIRDVNNYILNTNGKRRLHCHSECRELRKDMKQVSRNQLLTQDKSGDRTHASDGVGYLINVIEHF